VSKRAGKMIEDDELEVEVTEGEQHEEPEVETEKPESEPEHKELETEETEDDEDEVIVTIGDEEPKEAEPKAATPSWVKELRKAHRDTQKENRELRDKLKTLEEPAEKPATLGAKPKLEDYDYDAEQFEHKLTEWYDAKRKVDDQRAQAEAAQKEQEEAWQSKLSSYSEAKSQLKVRDFDDAEATVLEGLDQTQQGIIVQGADNPAVVVYALGKNPDRVKELSSIKDPVKFAFTVAKLEKDLKVKNRKAPPPPERTVSGTGPKSGAVDSTLERLRDEAAKTGNYSKVHQYRQQKRQAKT
jgi:hypothetical protein